MNYGFIHSIWTVLMMLLFIGIVVWAWSAKRKSGFEEAAHLPLEDDDVVIVAPTGEMKHG